MTKQNGLSFWEITRLPERSGGDWVAWLRSRTGIHVKISLGSWSDLSERKAMLIVSQLAGLMTVETLERDLTALDTPAMASDYKTGAE